MYFKKYVNRIETIRRQQEWRKRNTGNFTTLASITNMDQIQVGDYSYGRIYCMCYSDGPKLRIGRFCSIAPEVTFVLNADHPTNLISTYPFASKLNLGIDKMDLVSKGDIVVGDDCWIGYRSIVLSGVTIGQGAIISAGAVVTKDVPPYAIVGGVPAKVLRYRFDKDIINKLITIDYSLVTPEVIKKNYDIFTHPVNNMNLDEALIELFQDSY